MSDIFREVEDDLRREQARALWDRFGIYVIVTAVLVVAVTAGWRGWLWYSERQASLAGETYFDAMTLARDGSHADAEAAFSDIVGSGGPFAGYARLMTASQQAEAGDVEGAVATYDAIADDGRVDPLLRDLARIRAGYLLVDTASQEELQARIGAMAADGEGWRHSAREILGLAAWREGDIATASTLFDELIADQETPENMRGRAELMIALVAAERPAAAPADAAPEPVAAEETPAQEEAEGQ